MAERCSGARGWSSSIRTRKRGHSWGSSHESGVDANLAGFGVEGSQLERPADARSSSCMVPRAKLIGAQSEYSLSVLRLRSKRIQSGDSNEPQTVAKLRLAAEHAVRSRPGARWGANLIPGREAGSLFARNIANLQHASGRMLGRTFPCIRLESEVLRGSPTRAAAFQFLLCRACHEERGPLASMRGEAGHQQKGVGIVFGVFG